MEAYRSYKKKRGPEGRLYDNSRGSRLLALARAGMLPTRVHQQKLGLLSDATCGECFTHRETTGHILFECNEFYASVEDVRKALGFGDDIEYNIITKSRACLEKWEKKNVGSRDLVRP